ncbi:MAG: hypothetical protein HC830_02240 [Bacteroidetes bacterium]|nr:hypothetical protein [Bacteroidota bacterium]
MKKTILISLFVSVFTIAHTYSQQKNTVTPKKASTSQTVKTPVKPETTDKIIPGKKGPEGQPVYEGIKGGIYYINKNGNKTYLKEEDKIVSGKKGPEGQKVYLGPQGGEYYINKNGNKVYLKNNKK